MTPTDPTDQPNDKNPSTTSRTTTTTEHYARSTNTSPEPRTRATRSKDSHRGITICRRVAPGRVARPDRDPGSPELIYGGVVGRCLAC